MQKISFIIPSQPAMWREQMTARHKEYGKQRRTEQFTKEILRKIILVQHLTVQEIIYFYLSSINILAACLTECTWGGVNNLNDIVLYVGSLTLIVLNVHIKMSYVALMT